MKYWYFFCLLLVGIVSNAQIKLEGYVGDPQTGSPYDGVSVYIDQVLKAKTNTDGLFVLMTTAGKHEIKLTKEGLLDKKETINVGEIDFYETVMVKGVNPKPIIIEEVIEEKPLVISYRLDSLGNPKMDSLGNKIQINPDLKMVKIARDSMVTDSLGNENIFKVYEEKVYALSKDSLVLDSLGNPTAIVPIMNAESFSLDSLGNPIKVMQNYEQVWATRDSIALDSLGNPYTIVVREPIITSDTIKTNNLSVVEPTIEPTLIASSNSAALVIRKRDDGSEAAALNDQKNAKEIKQVVSSEELSNKGVSNAEGAVAEISGVNQVEGLGEIFIRGLGDRYLFTTINKLPIPSNDVEKKNINLDLIPTSIINSVELSKSHYPNYFADFGSGNVNVVTKTHTDKDFFAVDFSTGLNTNLFTDSAFNDFVASSTSTGSGFLDRNESLDEKLNTSWDSRNISTSLNYGLGASGGKKFTIFDKKASFLGEITFDKNFNYQRHDILRNYGTENDGTILRVEFTDYREFTNTTSTIGYGNLGFEFNRKNKLNFYTSLINQATDQVVLAGQNGESFLNVASSNLQPTVNGYEINDRRFKISTIFLNQLHGIHEISNKVNLDWGLGYTTLQADEPNSIINQFVEDNLGNLVLASETDFENRRSIQDINDKEMSAYFNFDYGFDLNSNTKGKLSIGGSGRNKTRDFYAIFYGLDKSNVSLPVFQNSIEIDQIIKDGIDSGDLSYKASPSNAYTGQLKTTASYANFFIETPKIDVNLGARFEVNTFDLSWDLNQASGGIGSYSESIPDIFPSVNLKYKFNRKSFLRLSSSKTISLPEIRELAPFIYLAPDGRSVQGNDELQASDIYNTDLKWELYPTDSEMLSIGAFGKYILDPVSIVVDPFNAAGYFRPYNTGEYAVVAGVELEMRKSIKEWSRHNKLSTVFNASYMFHQQQLLEKFYFDSRETQPLVGAADFIINTSLKYDLGIKNPLTLTATGNYTSDKIYALGGPLSTNSDVFGEYRGNIIQNGFLQLDFIASKKIKENISVKFKAMNLTNPNIKLTQESVDIDKGAPKIEGDSVIDSYKRGTNLSLGFEYKF